MPDFCECKHEGKIAMLEQRDAMIMDALSELKGKTDLILLQVTKVAVLEVNHGHQSEALGRAYSRIEKLEEGAADLATETREFMNTMNGMARMAKWMWSLMGGSLGLMMLKMLFGGQ